MKHKSVVVVALSDQTIDRDDHDLSALLSQHSGMEILAIGLRNSGNAELAYSGRVIRLPLDETQADTALAIGMQVCLNENSTFVGCLRTLSADALDEASRCLDVLQSGQADVVLVAASQQHLQCIFAAKSAAFAVSFWGALCGPFLDRRQDLLTGIIKASGRRAVVLKSDLIEESVGADLGQFKSLALPLRSKIGIGIGELPKPRAERVRRVAVITPYYKEPVAELTRCIESVRNQSLSCDHIMISDGYPSPVVADSEVRHIELGKAHADNGNTPRYVGGVVALALGYDAIAYLDADNWYHPKHIESVLKVQHETSATAVCSHRNIYLADGFKLKEADNEDLRRWHVDTSCLLITRECEFIAHLWGQMPQSWGPICDRVIYSALRGQHVVWTKNRTLNFKSNYAYHYRMAGRPLPDKVNDVPREFWYSFANETPEFIEMCKSRTGRFIRIHNPYAPVARFKAT